MQLDSTKKLLVGKINGFFGIKGFIKIFSYCQPPENIFNYQPWIIKTKDKQLEVKVEGKKHKNTLLAKLPEKDNLDAVLDLKDAQIFINRDLLEELPGDEFYQSDVLGFIVKNTNNITLGKLDYFINTPGANVMVIKGDKDYFIPFSQDFLKCVEQDKKQIIVNWEDDF